VTASAAFPPQLLPILLAVPYIHVQIEVLRRPVEFALHAPVGMMDKLLADLAPAGEDRQLQRIKSQIGAQVISDLPPDDLAENRSVINAV
jgi:hypothetical protein